MTGIFFAFIFFFPHENHKNCARFDEIRKLSEMSSAQSKTIGGKLSNIKESINKVVTAPQESSDVFCTVSRKIGRLHKKPKKYMIKTFSGI